MLLSIIAGNPYLRLEYRHSESQSLKKPNVGANVQHGTVKSTGASQKASDIRRPFDVPNHGTTISLSTVNTNFTSPTSPTKPQIAIQKPLLPQSIPQSHRRPSRLVYLNHLQWTNCWTPLHSPDRTLLDRQNIQVVLSSLGLEHHNSSKHCRPTIVQ